MVPEPELIDDRAVREADSDRFRLDDFAAELEKLACEAETPSNIALYGSWGSGKSSLSNLLENRLRKHDGLKFCRFDAFKYAEAPLRRHFLSQIAQGLGKPHSKYTTGLYTAETKRNYTIPALQIWSLAGKFLLLFGVVMIPVLIVSLIWLGLISKTPLDDFLTLDSIGFGAATVATALLALFVSVAGSTFQVNETRSAPSSEEEFERLFRDLVAEVKSTRIVILVDELDRCSPKEVVSTLETLRTFLEVEGCVFIVAADQRVLETAISQGSPQATPGEAANPHYSSGTEYLDKIFQYQMALPPIRPRRLTRFALELVEDRVGVWSEIDRAAVVSVLIPTHVRSPRRVKALLNGFVLLYRVVRIRADEGLVAGTASDRALEIAKLVCLRHEFPRFTADLERERRLPSLVAALAEDESATFDFHVREETRTLALAYARASLPVDQPLEQEPADQSTDEETDSEAESDGAPSVQTSPVAAARADDLIRYLQKTSHIPDPGADLVFLEGLGSAVGLEPGLAIQLEEDAVNGRSTAVRQVVGELSENERRAALRSIAHSVREAPVGIEASNVVSTLLQVIGDQPDQILDPIADELADAVAVHLRRHELRSQDLCGCLLLGLSSGRAVGHTLISNAVSGPAFRTEAQLRIAMIKNAASLSDHADQIGLAAAAMLSEPSEIETAISLIGNLPAETATSVLDSAVSPFGEAVGALSQEAQDV